MSAVKKERFEKFVNDSLSRVDAVLNIAKKEQFSPDDVDDVIDELNDFRGWLKGIKTAMDSE